MKKWIALSAVIVLALGITLTLQKGNNILDTARPIL